MDNFSRRYGYKLEPKEIEIREDAPSGLREFIIQSIYTYGYLPSFLRTTFCQLLRVAPDLNNWSEKPNIEYEVNELINNCPWFKVYDMIETLYERIDKKQKQKFEEEINEYFFVNGIGWQLIDGKINYRGEEIFENNLRNAEEILENAGLKTSSDEIKQAINDLSKRPEPDITGSIQHSLAALECTAREISGDRSATLGALIKKHSSIVPKPLDDVISKLYGFASEQGRHLQEGRVPEFNEAELAVSLSCALSSYLARKIKSDKSSENSIEDLF